jgi:hypothetical protein
MSWVDRAACHGLGDPTFFAAPWPVDYDEEAGDEVTGFDQGALDRARAICSSCPVRVPCFVDAMEVEGGSAEVMRHGLRGGVTPSQRYSIWRRDSASCIQCGETYDPLGLVVGDVVCGCGEFTEPPIPDTGDEWYPRHDALLAKLTTYLLEQTEPGDRILPPYRMLEALGHRRKDDMPLCYDRLIADGLIERGEGRGVYFRRAGRQALASYRPPARRRRGRLLGPGHGIAS